ncbi:MAG: M20 metallopeptidase family protein [Bacillota bacterium]
MEDKLLKYIKDEKVADYFAVYKNEIVKIRRELHKIPEIGFGTEKTASYLRKKLKIYGFEINEVLENGLIAYKKGSSSKKAVAFRADMDGLELNEATGVDYSSTHPGKMHGCGHDGHMAILLGFARYLSEFEELKRDIVLIFQPAEESPGGAEPLVENGIFADYNIAAIFGLHIYPGLEEGKIGIKSGPLTAQSGEVDIDLIGKGSHGAQPHDGKDALFIASQLLSNYQGIISRNFDPLKSGVVTFGKMESGSVRNVLAARARLEGTIRAFSEEKYELIKDRLKKINEGMEKAHEVEIEMEIRDFYPPVNNDPELYEMVDELLAEDEKIKMDALMIAEDFAYYQKAGPGFFFMLGSRNEKKGYIYPLHNQKFNFSEAVLFKGISLYIRLGRKMKII